MPVTKTAKRALRGSKRKLSVNTILKTRLEVAVRKAKRTKKAENILSAVSLADIAAKKKIIHKNKSSRIKSSLAKITPLQATKAKQKSTKKKSSK